MKVPHCRNYLNIPLIEVRGLYYLKIKLVPNIENAHLSKLSNHLLPIVMKVPHALSLLFQILIRFPPNIDHQQLGT